MPGGKDTSSTDTEKAGGGLRNQVCMQVVEGEEGMNFRIWCHRAYFC